MLIAFHPKGQEDCKKVTNSAMKNNVPLKICEEDLGRRLNLSMN